MKRAFTLIEILVVVGILSVLAAILFPVFNRAKDSAKKGTCLSNFVQIGMATAMYVSDADGTYPETKDSSGNPSVDDADGSLDEPDYASVFDLLLPYAHEGASVSLTKVFACESDLDPFGAACVQVNPDIPDVTSYLVNGYLVFGMSETSIPAASTLISYSERRSEAAHGAQPFCDYVYYPWFNPANPKAPENQMDGSIGAVATTRHNGLANYEFADSHVKTMPWTQTFSLPGLDLHQP